MSDAFDPYFAWLGIPGGERPPHHYRLLALSLFESDSAAIREAAEQVLVLLAPHLDGPNAADSRRIMQEVIAARDCLLHPPCKEAYDQRLAARLADDEASALDEGPRAGPSPSDTARQNRIASETMPHLESFVRPLAQPLPRAPLPEAPPIRPRATALVLGAVIVVVALTTLLAVVGAALLLTA